MGNSLRKNIDYALIEPGTVATSNSIAQGVPCILTATGTVTLVTTSSAKATHVSYGTEDGTWPATAGDKVSLVKIGSPCIVPVLVGTNGATCGEYGEAESDGVTDSGLEAGVNPICEFRQTGTAGALVGGWLGVSRNSVAES